MAEPPSPEQLRATFQALLNLALTRGRAYEHPDAEADCIAADHEGLDRH
jgi:hypothetical protein